MIAIKRWSGGAEEQLSKSAGAKHQRSDCETTRGEKRRKD